LGREVEIFLLTYLLTYLNVVNLKIFQR